MGLFGFAMKKEDKTGEKAYRLHAQANKQNDMGRGIDADNTYRQALDMYKQALDEGCKSPKILTGYSVLLMRYEHFEKAKQLINDIYAAPGMTADDKFHLALNHALCQWRLGETEKAIEDIKLTGEHPHTALYYDVVCPILISHGADTGDFSAAEKIVNEAFDYDDEDAATLCAKGNLLYRQGKKDEAAVYLKKAIKANPNHPGAKVILGIISNENGVKEAAKKYLNSALQVQFPTTCAYTRKYTEKLLDGIK